MKVKTKRDEWSWLWHVMDSETRFMVANLVTKQREVGDAQELFKEAREVGKSELLVTDGLQSYHKAFNKEFYDHHQESEHVVAEGLTARSSNKVERLHNTVRERVKVMRGLHSDKSAAVSKKESLRTTVPRSIVKQFDLTSRDSLEWKLEVREGEVILVRPCKSSK